MPSLPVAPDESVLPGPLLVVEDEPVTQLRLRAILTNLGYRDDALLCVGSIAQADALLVEEPVAMALVDIGLPDGSGIDLIRRLHRADPALPIVVISAWSTEQIIVSALQAGATGYLLKEREDVEIMLSIRSALRGGAPIDPFIARRILDLVGPGTPEGAGSKPNGDEAKEAVPALSAREAEILALVAKGLSNREISGLLCLSKLTVECHIKNIYKKLAVNSRTQAVFEGRSLGWLP